MLLSASYVYTISGLLAAGAAAAASSAQDYFQLGFDVYEGVGYGQKLVRRRDSAGSYQGHLLKRDGNETEISISNNATVAYMVNFTLGSNKTPMVAQLDTGSSDLWVYSSANGVCTGFCAADYGTYNPSSSTSANFTGENFTISYVDGTSANGEIIEDELVLGEYAVDAFTFGVVTADYNTNPVFGIGLAATEAFSDEYENFPQRLYSDGYIKSEVYSLYLNDITAVSGNFLAGAVDKNQFDGNLNLCPLVTLGERYYTYFYITSNGINITKIGNDSFGIATAKHPIIMDSGTSILYVPDVVYANLGQSFPGISLFPDIGYVAKCSVLEKYTFDIDLCGTTYNIPLRNLSYSIPDAVKYSLLDASSKLDKDEYCSVQIEQSGDNSILAGDLFMRYFYIYYDLENYQLGVAAANYDDNGNDIVTVTNSTSIGSFAVQGPKYSETYAGTTDTAASGDGEEVSTTTGAEATGFSGLKNNGNGQQSNVNALLMGASVVCVLMINGLMVPFI